MSSRHSSRKRKTRWKSRLKKKRKRTKKKKTEVPSIGYAYTTVVVRRFHSKYATLLLQVRMGCKLDVTRWKRHHPAQAKPNDEGASRAATFPSSRRFGCFLFPFTAQLWREVAEQCELSHHRPTGPDSLKKRPLSLSKSSSAVRPWKSRQNSRHKETCSAGPLPQRRIEAPCRAAVVCQYCRSAAPGPPMRETSVAEQTNS